MDFRILGPLEVLDEGRAVTLGGTKQRALLALLLVHANETLTTDRLIDELWGETPPANAAKTVQMQISRLRKALAAGAGGELIVTRERGYECRLDPERLDSHRFERLTAEGTGALAAGRPEPAADALERALALWRDAPLADLSYEPFAQGEIARLEDLRAGALEQLIEAKLTLGRHAEVIGRLETLIAEYPYRERLRAQLMLALYRCERQADALQAYQDARRQLVEELGIEPGERLRELERAILAQDKSLAAPAAPLPSDGQAVPAAPEELPTGVVTFALTDIEGSSGLWEADPKAMASALELHDGLIARVAEEHAGQLLKTKGEGDATVTVFRRASDAVESAVELQQEFAEAPWPGGLELRVRIALHTGEAHEREGDYFGPALNRAARLRALTRGGTTVMSQATAEIVHDGLPREVELVDLGRQQLRGLSRPERVFELRWVGAPLAPQDMRKTVTVLFSSVGVSAPEGRTLDPEARRRVMSRYFEDVRAVLERHGGTVEAYPGDAVMAVFGVPLLHEDDALRAVRAASEMRDELPVLADELERAFGVRPIARLGVGTGEVIATHPDADQPLATGEAVSFAARLEELAGAGEILIDEKTHRLVQGCVRAEPVGDQTLRSGEPLAALRLVELRPQAPGRVSTLESPLVNRERQLGALTSSFTAAVSDRACHLVTVLGAAGVGKSRLVQEFVGGLGDEGRVVRGRCLPYGEGITYWPLAEVVSDMTGAGGHGPAEQSVPAIAEQIAEEPKADLIVDGVAEALGIGGSKGGTSEEIFWSVRRLFEAVARRHPLVVVFDDLQWAEPTFLDLVEHVADLSRDAPLMMLCMARPELLDTRPGWGGGKLNATSILLEPLSEDETQELIANLLSRATLPHEAAVRLAEATEGNPLFAEELLAMLIDEGLLRREDGHWTAADELADLPVPPSIHALLAARLEALPDDERALLARASVEGTVFHRGALEELAPETLEASIERSLTSLVRRDIIRPDRAGLGEDEAFRFRHMLIRDAAYRSLSKEMRAQLHERFAAWVVRTAESRRGEFEEIVGYHLSEAYRHLAELGTVGERERALAVGAAERLGAAARSALVRGDLPAGARLLERAASVLEPDDPRRAAILPELGAALLEAGRLADADRVLAEAISCAAEDPGLQSRARVERELVRIQAETSAPIHEARQVAEAALPVLEEHGDELGQCRAWCLWAEHALVEGRVAEADEAWRRAAEHARLAGDEVALFEVLDWRAAAAVFGPTPVPEAIRRCEALREQVRDSPVAVASTLRALAPLHAMKGDIQEARRLVDASDDLLGELGGLHSAVSQQEALVEMLAGHHAAAEARLRSGCERLEQMGEKALLATTAAMLAQAVYAQGRHEEAMELSRVSERAAATNDLSAQVTWRGVRAKVFAAQDRGGEAEALAREAVRLAEPTDFLTIRADALLDLAEVLRHAGSSAEAEDAIRAALELYERKGDVVSAERARSRLGAVGRAT
jgi:predicted ATPase/class 3 adenylate cyclase/DNA-binding winged helix-turn-helix (wHTH) protein